MKSSEFERTVLVTGASSGVGRSLVHHLADRFHVIAVARRRSRLEEEFGNLEHVSVVAADLAQQRETERLGSWVQEEFGPIGFIVNSAGVNVRADMVDLSLDSLSLSVAVNAYAPFVLLQEILPSMSRRNFGRVINVTSGAPLNCFPGFGAYSGSKALLNALTVTAAREYAEKNVKINLMSPGPVRSEMSPDARMSPEVCHPTVDYLLNLDEDGATGRFFWLGYEVPLFPDLEGVDWLAGDARGKLRRAF